jgi:glycine cleavage system H protein
MKSTSLLLNSFLGKGVNSMAISLAVLTFLFFIALDVVVLKVQARRFALAGLDVTDFRLPKGLFFHKGHTWVNIETSGKMKIGVDDFAQRILGRFDGFMLRNVGEFVKQGEEILSVRQGKRTAVFNSPVDGVIRSINEKVTEDPIVKREYPYVDGVILINEKVTEDPIVVREYPYEAGWIYSIEPTNLAIDVERLISNKKALSWLRNEIRKFRDFLAEQSLQNKLVGQTLQDGGLPVDGLLEHMDDFIWTCFQEEFLAK